MELDQGCADEPSACGLMASTAHEAFRLRRPGESFFCGAGNGVLPSSSCTEQEEARPFLEIRLPSLDMARLRKPAKYRECLKNHAASRGGLALDGCGEFMPSGADGTMEALMCAACECHRNFHRQEVEAEKDHSFSRWGAPLLAPPQPAPPALALMAVPGQPGTSQMIMALGGARPDLDATVKGGFASPLSIMNPSGMILRKRFRTKFTSEQKQEMLDFAEKLGWRLEKHNEQSVQRFCAGIGVKRHVLKVWMHNNKNTRSKKPSF